MWPSQPAEHGETIDRYFAGGAQEPLEALLAIDAEGRAVGFIELSIRAYAEGCTTDRVAFIEGWYVVPRARRQGIGAELVRAAEVWARGRGCTELGSDTEVENAASAAAHAAVGFRETGVVRCFLKSV